MTAREIIYGTELAGGGVREEIGDDLEPFRWTDAALLEHVCAGVREIWRLRPSAAYVTRIVTVCPAVPAGLDETVLLRDSARLALVYFVASRAMSRDAEHPENAAMAASWMERFTAEVRGA